MDDKADMKEGNFSIVFMGTPEFAVGILDGILHAGIPVLAVITAPDKPSGRGQKIGQSAVKAYALEYGLPILQPVSLKDEYFLEELSEIGADLFVVVAFRMLPEEVWSMPPMGTINLHASLLPQYRGAAPINWAIINGEEKTGVTTFFIEKEIDTGEVIEQAETSIGENMTVGELYQVLMDLGSKVMVSTIGRIRQGKVQGLPQRELIQGELKPAPKIFKEDCRIDFNQPVARVHDFCRGLDPYPAAWCVLRDTVKQEDRSYKLFTSRKTDILVADAWQLKAGGKGLLFPCADHYLEIRDIQPEGKRKMTFREFLAGNPVENLVIKPFHN